MRILLKGNTQWPLYKGIAIGELLERSHRIEEGFEVRDEKYDYGKKTRKVIGVIAGFTIYRQKI